VEGREETPTGSPQKTIGLSSGHSAENVHFDRLRVSRQPSFDGSDCLFPKDFAISINSLSMKITRQMKVDGTLAAC
jgi:hypothetical protein